MDNLSEHLWIDTDGKSVKSMTCDRTQVFFVYTTIWVFLLVNSAFRIFGRDRLIENFTKMTAFFINKTVVCEPTVLIARQCKACIVVTSGVNFWTTLLYLGVKISFQISTGNSCSVKYKEKVSDGVFSYLNLVWRSETSLEKNIFREVFQRNFLNFWEFIL